MCCKLSDGCPNMCRTCNKLKRKFPTSPDLVDLKNTTRFCVDCEVWKAAKTMRKNTQYLDCRDNICQSCFQKKYKYLTVKKKHVKQPSLRVIRWGRAGQERRCAQTKHWVQVEEMCKDKAFVDEIGVNCIKCKTLPKRKLNKSQRKHEFGGKKVKQAEMEEAKKRLLGGSSVAF
jgi:hypothetical protein